MILVGHMIRQIFTTFLKILMSSLEKDTWNKCEIVVSGKWKFNFELIRNLPPPWLPPTTMSSSARLLSFSTCTLCHIWCQINCSGSLYQYGITDLSSNTCLLTVGRKSFFPNISRHFFFSLYSSQCLSLTMETKDSSYILQIQWFQRLHCLITGATNIFSNIVHYPVSHWVLFW